MPRLITAPAVIPSAGNKPKIIEEYVGRVNTQTAELSVARMTSPGGWVEPGQTPSFMEITVVIAGELHVEHREGRLKVKRGQAVVTEPNEWIRYSTPTAEGAHYVAICLPAFTPETVNRDDDPPLQ